MTSSLTPVSLTKDFDSDPLAAANKIDSTAVDAQLAILRDRCNALLTLLDGILRSDNTLADELILVRHLSPEVLAAFGVPATAPLLSGNNLSDLTNVASALSVLGLTGALIGSQNLADVPDKNAARIALGVNGALLGANNLSDLASVATALVNLRRGLFDGLCDLDGSGRIPAARLPSIAGRAEIVEDYLGSISAVNGALSTFPMVVGSSGYWIAIAATDPAHPGIVRLSTNTTIGGYAASVSGTCLRLAGGVVTFEAIAQVQTLSTVTNRFEWVSGIVNQVSALPTNGCYFRYSHDVNGGNLQAVCMFAGVPTVADTGYAVNILDWPRLTIVVNASATSVEYYVNGTLRATITLTIPIGVALAAGMTVAKTAGPAESYVHLDLQGLSYALNNAR